MKRLLLISLLMPLLTGCFVIEYNCNIKDVPDTGNIPQEGSVVKVHYSYVMVQTKFQPGEYYQPFRYRALVSDMEYSYAEAPAAIEHSHEESAFAVAVPRNNSYEQRSVRIDVSLAKSRDDQSWGDWRTVYSGTQDSMDKGRPLRPSVKDRIICLVFDGMAMEVEEADNESVRCLKDLLLDGEITLEMVVANNGMYTSRCEGTQRLGSGVPLNHTVLKRISKGDIFFTDYGGLSIENVNHKRGVYGHETYIGRLTDKSLETLDGICCSDRYFDPGTYPMQLRLR